MPFVLMVVGVEVRFLVEMEVADGDDLQRAVDFLSLYLFIIYPVLHVLHDTRHGNQLIRVEGNIRLAKFGAVDSSRFGHDDTVGYLHCFVEKNGCPHVDVSP